MCRDCGAGPLAPRRAGRSRPGVHMARGLCGCCYGRHYEAGTLWGYARITRTSAELVAEAEVLRARGWFGSWPAIAAELGVSFAALDKARERARRARVAS